MDIIERTDDGRLLLRVSKSLYHHESIQKAAYKFTDSCFVYINPIDADNYEVSFLPKNSGAELNSKINEFCNELIDEELRYSLNASSKPIKELIIRKAFFPFENE